MKEDQLILALLEEVIALWRQQFTDVEIGSDVRKIELLEAARLRLADTVRHVPTEISDLYAKVYLRNVWTEKRDIQRE